MTDENVEISWDPEQMVEVTLRQPDDGSLRRTGL